MLTFEPSLRQEQMIGAAPARRETLLRLELLLSQRSVDLRAASDLIVGDQGLRDHVFELAVECGEVSHLFPNLTECIIGLGVAGLRESIRRAY